MSLSFNAALEAVEIVIEAGHVPNIVGLQGIGKSALVKTMCKKNNWALEVMTCSFLQEGDLAMPYQVENSVEYAICNQVRRLNEKSSKYSKCILFLDEFNRGSEHVQSELMNLVLQREIAGFRLNGNVHIVLAMNPSSSMRGYEDSDYSVSFSDRAIMGRVVSLDMKPILSEWLKYCDKSVDESVKSFLKSNPKLFLTKETGSDINCTPRGWERVSDICKVIRKRGILSVNFVSEIFIGTISESAVKSFTAYFISTLSNSSTKSGTDYFHYMENILNADSEDDWDEGIYELDDAELDQVFKLCVQDADENSDKNVANIARLVTSASKSLVYPWSNHIKLSKPRLFARLCEDAEFYSTVSDVLKSTTGGTRGGFKGKAV